MVSFALSRDRIREQLCKELEQVAQRSGCRTIALTMAAGTYGNPRSPSRAKLERLGMKLETVCFVRDLRQSTT
jgi:hypothetical protein